MLMKFSHVTVDGKFEKTGNEHVMYAVMLIMRGVLCMFGSLLLTISTTIAIRYSCVRRQTSDLEGYFLSFLVNHKENLKNNIRNIRFLRKEKQILDYQTQQYRLFPALRYFQIFFGTFLLHYKTLNFSPGTLNFYI